LLKGKTRTNIITLNRLCAISKVDSVIKIISDLIDAGEKVIIFSQFKDPLFKLKYKFHDKCVYIDGSVSALDRQDEIVKFKTDKTKMVYIAQLVAGGIGVNLTNSSKVIFLDLPFTSDKIEQGFQRSLRKGQTKDVDVMYMLLQGSIDEKIFALVKSKAADIAEVIDGGESDINYGKIEEKLLDEILLEKRGIKQTGFQKV
jgi:SWI/SNF-related matrix-associated actin-dependent regulator 1 of chromatin subfamily A